MSQFSNALFAKLVPWSLFSSFVLAIPI